MQGQPPWIWIWRTYRRRRSSPISFTRRWRRRCWPPRAHAEIPWSTVSACCSIRLNQASKVGSAGTPKSRWLCGPMCLRAKPPREKNVKAKHKAALTTPSLVIGLTGSAGMGKSTVAAFFKHLGIPVFDADRAVHLVAGAKRQSLEGGGDAFSRHGRRQRRGPQSYRREGLRQSRSLERSGVIIHPLVREDRERFLQRAGLARHPIVVLDIPLLFEGQTHAICDSVIVVSAPTFLQRQRALARPGMTPARLQSILSRQWSDQRKRAAADVVIPSGLGKRETLRRLMVLALRLRKAFAGRLWSSSTFMRQIILDTETTGFERAHRRSDRRNRRDRDSQPFADRSDLPSLSQSGTRDMRGGSRTRTRLVGECVSGGRNRFSARSAEELLAFIADAPLVAHNASFRHRFRQCRAGARRTQPRCPTERVIDTVRICARRKFPRRSSRSLDAALPAISRSTRPIAAISTGRCSTLRAARQGLSGPKRLVGGREPWASCLNVAPVGRQRFMSADGPRT